MRSYVRMQKLLKARLIYYGTWLSFWNVKQ